MAFVVRVALFVAPLLWLAGFAVGRMGRDSGRHRRRGGYIRPGSPASTSASRATDTVLRISMACKPDGRQPAVTDGLALRRALSNSGARGSFMSVTGYRRGARTTDAE